MVQLSIDNNVVNHLLFHKSLIDEHTDASRINQYIAMAQQAQDGEHLSISNPFDRSIALAFELVLHHQFDPWGIDLIGFSSLYLKRAKDEKIDLITAGKIIYMAWKVLRLQSDTLVGSMEAQQENPDKDFSDFSWADLPSGEWWGNDDGYSYTNLVMSQPKPPLEEPIRRHVERKVSLMELLSAFDHVRHEAEEYQLLDKRRKEERERLALLAKQHMKGTAHEDHLEHDIVSVWEKISTFSKSSICLEELCPTQSAEDRIKTFISILFLAYENKINVMQKKFPFGKIFITIKGYT